MSVTMNPEVRRQLDAKTRPIRQELLEAGPTIGLPVSNRALGISRAHGYALARRGEYPVRLLKLGSSYRVVTAELLRLLGIDADQPAASRD